MLRRFLILRNLSPMPAIAVPMTMMRVVPKAPPPLPSLTIRLPEYDVTDADAFMFKSLTSGLHPVTLENGIDKAVEVASPTQFHQLCKTISLIAATLKHKDPPSFRCMNVIIHDILLHRTVDELITTEECAASFLSCVRMICDCGGTFQRRFSKVHSLRLIARAASFVQTDEGASIFFHTIRALYYQNEECRNHSFHGIKHQVLRLGENHINSDAAARVFLNAVHNVVFKSQHCQRCMSSMQAREVFISVCRRFVHDRGTTAIFLRIIAEITYSDGSYARYIFFTSAMRHELVRILEFVGTKELLSRYVHCLRSLINKQKKSAKVFVTEEPFKNAVTKVASLMCELQNDSLSTAVDFLKLLKAVCWTRQFKEVAAPLAENPEICGAVFACWRVILVHESALQCFPRASAEAIVAPFVCFLFAENDDSHFKRELVKNIDLACSVMFLAAELTARSDEKYLRHVAAEKEKHGADHKIAFADCSADLSWFVSAVVRFTGFFKVHLKLLNRLASSPSMRRVLSSQTRLLALAHEHRWSRERDFLKSLLQCLSRTTSVDLPADAKRWMISDPFFSNGLFFYSRMIDALFADDKESLEFCHHHLSCVVGQLTYKNAEASAALCTSPQGRVILAQLVRLTIQFPCQTWVITILNNISSSQPDLRPTLWTTDVVELFANAEVAPKRRTNFLQALCSLTWNTLDGMMMFRNDARIVANVKKHCAEATPESFPVIRMLKIMEFIDSNEMDAIMKRHKQ